MFIDGIKLEELEELEDDETLNVGVIVSGNRLEEHHVWCMIERWYIRQGWWNTAEEYDCDSQQNLYYYLKCSLQNVIYLPKVWIWQCRCQSWWLPAVTRAQLSWTLQCWCPNAPSGFSHLCYFGFLPSFFCLGSSTHREFPFSHSEHHG